MDFEKKQRYLGEKGLIFFITLMNMYIPLSTDIYLPALPSMEVYFKANTSLTSLTLSSFMFLYAFGLLIWGPISEKYGRKKILIINFIIYILSSLMCVYAGSIYNLIVMRALQGIGSGGITSVSMAIVKDSFSGKKRDKILALVQSMAGIAPIVAPILGAWILSVTGWRTVFWVLISFSIVCLTLSFLFNDTLSLNERYRGNLLGALGRLVVVAKNRRLLFPVLVFALSTLHFMGYLAISSFVYVKGFGLNERMYSYYFASNSIISVFGPIIYVKFLIDINKKRLTYIFFSLNFISGISMMLIGSKASIYFMLSFVIFSTVSAAMRPFSSGMLLDKQKGDTGSTSSVISTIMTASGSLGMVIASGPWKNVILGFGMQISICSLLAFILWYLICRSNISIIYQTQYK
ncbi:MAG: Bcr/CflA family efflux MFS transporter [Oscillospiraceae bacterium]|nr:Bcr/CflA family efflux MFS transporter [Oscillospiraceae bacterium]